MLGIYAKMVNAWEEGRKDEKAGAADNPFDASEYTQRAQHYAYKRGVESADWQAANQFVLGKDKAKDCRERLAEDICKLKAHKDMPFAELYVRLERAESGEPVEDATPDPWIADDTPVEQPEGTVDCPF
jgi:hypothetical protein